MGIREWTGLIPRFFSIFESDIIRYIILWAYNGKIYTILIQNISSKGGLFIGGLIFQFQGIFKNGFRFRRFFPLLSLLRINFEWDIHSISEFFKIFQKLFSLAPIRNALVTILRCCLPIECIQNNIIMIPSTKSL